MFRNISKKIDKSGHFGKSGHFSGKFYSKVSTNKHTFEYYNKDILNRMKNTRIIDNILMLLIEYRSESNIFEFIKLMLQIIKRYFF